MHSNYRVYQYVLTKWRIKYRYCNLQQAKWEGEKISML